MSQSTASRFAAALSIGATLALACGFLFHVPGFSGIAPSLQWTWMRLPALRIYPWLALAAAPILYSQILFPRRPRIAIALLSLGIISLQWTEVFAGVSPERPMKRSP